MNEKDARVRYTKEMIRKSFLELLKEKPAAKITVKELCEKSGINRATFYKHYADVYDLLEKLEQQFLEEERKSLESLNLNSLENMYRVTLLSLKENKETWIGLAGWNGDPHFTVRQMEVIRSFSLPLLQKKLPKLSEEKQKLVYAYLMQGAGSVIYSWVREGAPSLDETVHVLSELTAGVCEAAGRLAGEENTVVCKRRDTDAVKGKK